MSQQTTTKTKLFQQTIQATALREFHTNILILNILSLIKYVLNQGMLVAQLRWRTKRTEECKRARCRLQKVIYLTIALSVRAIWEGANSNNSNNCEYIE